MICIYLPAFSIFVSLHFNISDFNDFNIKMYSAIEMFKFLFTNLWIEHILYLIIIKEEEVGVTVEELNDYCIDNDWDGEMSLDIIIRDDADFRSERVKYSILESLREEDCGCGMCRR